MCLTHFTAITTISKFYGTLKTFFTLNCNKHLSNKIHVQMNTSMPLYKYVAYIRYVYSRYTPKARIP